MGTGRALNDEGAPGGRPFGELAARAGAVLIGMDQPQPVLLPQDEHV
ncbi:MAG: hypothetical protein QOK49_1902 [Baekduia sp.]|nr:hypothetical protein [Baekduia sp.]